MACADKAYPLRAEKRLPVHGGGRILLDFGAEPERDPPGAARPPQPLGPRAHRARQRAAPADPPAARAAAGKRPAGRVRVVRARVADFEIDLKRHRHSPGTWRASSATGSPGARSTAATPATHTISPFASTTGSERRSARGTLRSVNRSWSDFVPPSPAGRIRSPSRQDRTVTVGAELLGRQDDLAALAGMRLDLPVAEASAAGHVQGDRLRSGRPRPRARTAPGRTRRRRGRRRRRRARACRGRRAAGSPRCGRARRTAPASRESTSRASAAGSSPQRGQLGRRAEPLERLVHRRPRRSPAPRAGAAPSRRCCARRPGSARAGAASPRASHARARNRCPRSTGPRATRARASGTSRACPRA